MLNKSENFYMQKKCKSSEKEGINLHKVLELQKSVYNFIL